MSENSDFALKPEELEAVKIWAEGKTMTEAYCEVFKKKEDLESVPKQTLNKRIQRFFGTDRMKQAMAASSFEREEKFKKEQERKKAIESYTPVIKNIVPKIQKAVEEEKKKEKKKKAEEKKLERESASYFFDKIVRPTLVCTKKDDQEEQTIEARLKSDSVTDEQRAAAMLNNSIPDSNVAVSKQEQTSLSNNSSNIQQDDVPNKTAKEKWIESLLITDDPSALSVYGTGQFMMYHAVNEIIRRDREIKKRGIDVFDKDGSVFTPTVISAIKTAASMIIPFTPTQENSKDNSIPMAVTLLGLMQDDIKVDPDAYTAPIPPTVTIDVTNGESKNENKD